MQLKPGTILISTPVMDDPLFEKAVVFIAEYNEDGAMGFIINKLFPRKFNELTEFITAHALPLYAGGPVEAGQLFFLHKSPGLIEGGNCLTDTIFLGGNFKQAVQQNIEGHLADNDMQLFIGYCGWEKSQLEAEIAEGGWLVADNGNEYLFNYPATVVWEEVYNAANQLAKFPNFNSN